MLLLSSRAVVTVFGNQSTVSLNKQWLLQYLCSPHFADMNTEVKWLKEEQEVPVFLGKGALFFGHSTK